MKKLSLKTRMGKIISLWPILIIGLFGFSLVKSLSKAIEVKGRIENIEERIEKAKKENEELKASVAEAESVEFVEKQIRDKLGLSKEGEIVLVLPDEETLRKIAPVIEEEEDILPPHNYQKWLQLFL